MDEPTGSTSSRLTTAQLLAVATELDPSVTARRLEFWRNQGLLPHPERTGQDGTRPIWTYPPQAENELRALLRLREATKNSTSPTSTPACTSHNTGSSPHPTTSTTCSASN